MLCCTVKTDFVRRRDHIRRRMRRLLAVFSRPAKPVQGQASQGLFHPAEEQIRSVWRERRLFRLPPDGSMGAPMYGTTAHKKKLT